MDIFEVIQKRFSCRRYKVQPVEEEKLATCWIGAFDQEEVKRILGIPERYKVVALLPVGYPAQKEGEKLRKSLEEIVCWEKFEDD